MKSYKTFKGGYTDPLGYTIIELEKMLLNVYKDHIDYQEDGFNKMVDLFAKDNFYNMHYVAKEYLKWT